jgi:Ca2+-binding RTX toxin-like protein
VAGKLLRTACALGALTAAFIGAPSAHAGTASVQGAAVVYTDNPGEARAIKWARDGSSIGIQETVRGIGDKISATAGPGCVVDKRNDATATFVCSADGITDVRIELGDGDDAAEATGTSAFANPTRFFQDLAFPVTVIGGDGNDEITGGPLPDVLDGGAGDDQIFGDRDSHTADSADHPATDTMNGGPGNDTIGAGRTIDGGDGDDTIYASRVGASILGGPGKDTIQGHVGPDTIDGGDGNDTIDSSDSADVITGGEGDDTIDSGEGDDRIDAGGGADDVDARSGADKLAGGDGPDNLDGGQGADTYSGGAGNDRLTSADGAKDVLDCGAGDDTVTSWDRPKDKAVPRESCEHVPEGGIDGRRSFVLGYVKGANTGRLKVRFRCVDCEVLKVALIGWQFYFVPNKPGLAIGAGCPQGKTIKLKRTKLDQFDGVIPLTRCERTRLKRVAADERRGRARFRRFTFAFRTSGRTNGQVDTRGKR